MCAASKLPKSRCTCAGWCAKKLSKELCKLVASATLDQAVSSAAVSGPLQRIVVPNFCTIWNVASSCNVAHVLLVAWNHVTWVEPAVYIWNSPSLKAYT
eukprot:4436-Ditylum_brightwellii.AAC.1